MLDKDVASKIVKDCIRFAGKFKGEIKAQHKLESVGIDSEFTIDFLLNQIVNSNKRGVPSVSYEIDANDLTITTGTKVFELRDQVSENANPASKTPGGKP
jgi:hypothetical protein